MGTSLNGLTPANTYQGLIKFGDNSALTSVLKALSDGNGNDTMLELSTTALQIGGSTGLFWDNTNKRLGVGTSSPTVQFEVQTNARIRGDLNLNGSLNNSATGLINIGGLAYVNNITGNVGVGITPPTARLQIRGSGSTSATNALLVQNSSGSAIITATDDRVVSINNQLSVTHLGFGQWLNVNSSNNQLCIRGYANGPSDHIWQTSANYSNSNFRQSVSGFGFRIGAMPTIDASAIVDITSTTQGFLPPRQLASQRTAIASPAVGLMVYQTDGTEGLYVYKSTGWTFVA